MHVDDVFVVANIVVDVMAWMTILASDSNDCGGGMGGWVNGVGCLHFGIVRLIHDVILGA